MEPSANASIPPPAPPKSPSKPTNASGGQRSGPAWRSCVKPMPKRHKAALLFPVISSTSRTSSASDNVSTSTSSSASGNSSSRSSILSTEIPGAGPSSAAPSVQVQVIHRPKPPAPIPAAGRRSSQNQISQMSVQALAKHQAKITNYFVKKVSGSGLLQSAPRSPASALPSEVNKIDIIEESQSQSLYGAFEPRFASTQVDFDFDVTRLEPGQSVGHPKPQTQPQHGPEPFSFSVDCVGAQPEKMPPPGATELSTELFTSDPEDADEGNGKEEVAATATTRSIDIEEEDTWFGPQSQSPLLIPAGRGSDALPMRLPKTPERRPQPIPILRTPSPTERSPLRVGDMTMDLIRNFDRVPARPGSPPSPGFAYKPERAIRKKDERARLQGWDCEMCRDYYEAIASQLTAEELQKLKDKCSRHRYKYAPNPGTPPGYWDVDFPSTQECIQKGYMGIGIRTPPSKTAKSDVSVSRGSQSPLFSTPPSSSRLSTPELNFNGSPRTTPSAVVVAVAEPASPVTPISQSPRQSPVQFSSRGRGKSRRSASSGSSSGRVGKGDPSPRRPGSRSSKGWKGIKTTGAARRVQRVKKFKPATPKSKHHPQPTPTPSSPFKSAPPPIPPKPTQIEPVPGHCSTTAKETDFNEDFQRALTEFDDLDQETMLDSEDQARFCPLSPSLTPKWPRSNKIIVVPQLAVGSPLAARRARQLQHQSTAAAATASKSTPPAPAIKKLNL